MRRVALAFNRPVSPIGATQNAKSLFVPSCARAVKDATELIWPTHHEIRLAIRTARNGYGSVPCMLMGLPTGEASYCRNSGARRDFVGSVTNLPVSYKRQGSSSLSEALLDSAP
jgi:hypothetical protein